MLEPTRFSFDGAAVRVITREGEPWFVASDVCAVLGIGNVSMATTRLDDDEKGISSVDTFRGTQQTLIINESGLYSLVLTSRKPEAKRFKRWVTAEVLPAIRKTGAYSVAPALPDFQDPAAAARAWALQFEQARALRIQTEQQAAQLVLAAPKVEFADAILNSDGTAKVGEVAKTLGLPVQKLHRALRIKGVILPDNTPAAQYVDKGYFKPAPHKPYQGSTGERFTFSTRVTARGIQWIRKFAERHADLLTPNKGARKAGKAAHA